MTTARGPFPFTRMRRLRASNFARSLTAENALTPHDLIYPMFVLEVYYEYTNKKKSI